MTNFDEWKVRPGYATSKVRLYHSPCPNGNEKSDKDRLTVRRWKGWHCLGCRKRVPKAVQDIAMLALVNHRYTAKDI